MATPAQTLDYVLHSNCLDGVRLSRDQTQQILTGEVPPDASLTAPDGRSWEAEVVLGHVRALQAMEQLAQSDVIITEADILGMHQALMGELLLAAGEYRECTLKYKGLLIASPPQALPVRMRSFVSLLNQGLGQASDGHRFSWRAHHELITLHPFIEGNGRMARLVLNLVRLRLGLDLTIIPITQRERYSRAILEFQEQLIRVAQAKKGAAH